MFDWKQAVRERVEPLRLKTPVESDYVEELAQHLEEYYRELRSSGLGDVEARGLALAELDDMAALEISLEKSQRLPGREPIQLGDSRPAGFAKARWLEDLWKDLRYAGRSMRHSPVFVLVAVGALALGIGANTTVFTLINTLILNPLPAPDTGSLRGLAAVDVQKTAKSAAFFPLSYPDLADYQAGNRVFSSLGGYTSPMGTTWREQGAAQGAFAELVTSDYFGALGITPARGRFFSPGENTLAGARPVAVINYACWQKRLGGSSDVIGREIEINNVTFTVIGVAPPRFLGVNAIFGPDVWIPAVMAERLFPNTMQHALIDRAKPVFFGIGRLKPRVTVAQAAADVAGIGASLARTYPSTDEGHDASIRPLSDMLLGSAQSSSSPVLFGSAALFAVVGIVLLIACSNVANLLLARAAGRQQELAVRLAMGASRPRLVRQMLTESVVLGLVGGAVGFGVAYAGLGALFGQLPGWVNFPTPKLDLTVFAFALLISLAAGLVFGALPAWKASHANVAESLKDNGRTSGRTRGRVSLANGLLVGQVAFSFLLLVMAALFLRSIGRAYSIDPGFQTAHLAVFPTNPGQAGYTPAQSQEFYREVRYRVSRLPGVASVSWSSNMPLWARTVTGLAVEGWQPRSRADQIRAVVTTIDRDYFETAGIALATGRMFTNADDQSSAPVAIVNETLAREYLAGGAIGKRVQLPGEKIARKIVGVARTANYSGWGEPPQPCVYEPLAQKSSDGMILYIRTRTDPHELVAPVEGEIHAAGPPVLIFGVRTGGEIVDGGLFQAKMAVALLAIFGLLALGLASIGLYGVLAYSVNQRRREIGVRMALGSTRAAVLRLVLREGMSLVIAGVAIGYVVSLGAGRLLSGMLFGVAATDPASVAMAAVALSGVALLACYLPARWATHIDPLKALRDA